MQVADRTGRDLDEILSWTPAKFELWVGYFNLKAKREAEAAKRSTTRA